MDHEEEEKFNEKEDTLGVYEMNIGNWKKVVVDDEAWERLMVTLKWAKPLKTLREIGTTKKGGCLPHLQGLAYFRCSCHDGPMPEYSPVSSL